MGDFGWQFRTASFLRNWEIVCKCRMWMSVDLGKISYICSVLEVWFWFGDIDNIYIYIYIILVGEMISLKDVGQYIDAFILLDTISNQHWGWYPSKSSKMYWRMTTNDPTSWPKWLWRVNYPCEQPLNVFRIVRKSTKVAGSTWSSLTHP